MFGDAGTEGQEAQMDFSVLRRDAFKSGGSARDAEMPRCWCQMMWET